MIKIDAIIMCDNCDARAQSSILYDNYGRMMNVSCPEYWVVKNKSTIDQYSMSYDRWLFCSLNCKKTHETKDKLEKLLK